MANDREDAGRGRRADVVKKSKASQSKTPFYAVIGVVLLCGLGALAYVANRPKNVATTVDATKIVAGDPQGYLLGKPDDKLEYRSPRGRVALSPASGPRPRRAVCATGPLGTARSGSTS